MKKWAGRWVYSGKRRTGVVWTFSVFFFFTPNPLRETKQHYIPNPSAILLPKNPYQTKKQLKPIIGITHLRPKDKNTSDRRLGIEHLNNYSQNRSNIPNK